MLKALISFLSHFSERERLIFYGALTVISLALLERLMLNPIMSELELLDEKIRHEKAYIREALHITSQKDRMGRETRLYADYLHKPPSEEEETLALLRYVENLTAQSRVSLMGIRASGIRREASSKQYLITLTCEGQIEQIVDFLYNVESSDQLLRVERWQMAPKTEGSIIISCTIDILKLVIL